MVVSLTTSLWVESQAFISILRDSTSSESHKFSAPSLPLGLILHLPSPLFTLGLISEFPQLGEPRLSLPGTADLPAYPTPRPGP
jgi:hypothetical protein